MDPTGFAVGVVGLAGLVSTCIEAFQILRSIRAFSRDTEILFTKLDIEKELFMQWAQQVGLLKKHQIDQRLFDKRTDLLIYRVLKEVKNLLLHATRIQGKYGETPIGLHYAGKGQRYGEVDSRESSRKISFRHKFIWTIHTRDELTGLIDQLGYFIGKLNQMIPSIEQRKATCKDLKEAGADVSTLMLAGARTDGGYDDGDWSDLASEVANKAGERMGYSESRSSDSDSERDREIRRRRRSQDKYKPGRHQRRRSVDQESRVSSSSYRSSGSTLAEMFGDVVGSHPRPTSTWR